MGKANGTKAAPFYTTDEGLVLELKAIRPLVLDRFTIEWNKKHPDPLPPVIILDNGDEWRDAKDAWYNQLMADHAGDRERALTEFLLSYGVKTKPPEGWQPIIDWDEVSERYSWLSEVLSADDLEGLVNAVVGIDNPTPDGIEEAEKNSTPAGVDSG